MANPRLEQLESYALEVIEGRAQGLGPACLRVLLRQLAFVFEGVVQLRLALYRHGILRHHRLGCQVISVGNLTVGGTGKTPVVEVLARKLSERGRKVAILSRGYKKDRPPRTTRWRHRLKRMGQEDPPLVVSDGRNLLLDAARSGDEPFMLASNLPEVAVIVDKNRVKAGRYAISRFGCDTLILDDGFQYQALAHRMDVVLVDRTNPFGNGRMLPRGTLREPVRNIRRAAFIFITKSDGEGSEALRRQLRSLNPDAQILACRHCPRYLQSVYLRDREPLESLRGMPVLALSGIAAPRGFEAELERLGARVVGHLRYADHHRYTQQEVLNAINQGLARGAQAILTTEKDAVRFPFLDRRDLPIYFLRVEIEMLKGAEGDFDDWIRRKICLVG